MREHLKTLKEKSKISLKIIVKIKMKENALEYLLMLKGNHSKMDKLVYTDFKLQEYLKSDISKESV